MPAQNAHYLESKILTATPQRLHLMLIEGAIRFGRQAETLLCRGDTAAASAPLLRAIDVVGEMLAGVRQQKSDVNTRLAELYWFLFRRLSEAKINSDAGKLAEAIKLLEYERATWQMVCEKATQADGNQSAAQGVSSQPVRQKYPAGISTNSTQAGFSFEV
ncbi:MAG: flagellar export chaperone FliS [Pirellulales bacterium]